jgi:hypothetical protein
MLSTKLAGAAVAATKNCYLLTLRMSLMTAMMFPALLMLKLPREESPLVSSKPYTGERDQETLTARWRKMNVPFGLWSEAASVTRRNDSPALWLLSLADSKSDRANESAEKGPTIK